MLCSYRENPTEKSVSWVREPFPRDTDRQWGSGDVSLVVIVLSVLCEVFRSLVMLDRSEKNGVSL